MTQIPAPMLLETRFDIDQTSDLLEWRFVRRDQHAEPDKGKEAGIINFTVGEDFHVMIKAGSVKPFQGFEVLDCCLITRPYIYRCGPDTPTEYAPPSPFLAPDKGEVMGASVPIPGGDFTLHPLPARRKYHQIAREWSDHLTIGDVKARWDMSFVVTVRIQRDEEHSEVRVFSFDPETEVGSGVLEEEDLQPMMVSMLPETDPTSGVL